MLDRLNQPARDFMDRAKAEADRLGHDWLGTEHMLLALCDEPDVLGADAAAVRASVEAAVPPPVAGAGRLRQLPLTPRAKRVLERTVEEARSLGNNFLDPRHVAAALAREKDGVVADALREAGVTVDKAREAARRHMEGHTAPGFDPLPASDTSPPYPLERERRPAAVVHGAGFVFGASIGVVLATIRPEDRSFLTLGAVGVAMATGTAVLLPRITSVDDDAAFWRAAFFGLLIGIFAATKLLG